MTENKVTMKERVKNFVQEYEEELAGIALTASIGFTAYQIGKYVGITQTHVAWLTAALNAKTK